MIIGENLLDGNLQCNLLVVFKFYTLLKYIYGHLIYIFNVSTLKVTFKLHSFHMKIYRNIHNRLPKNILNCKTEGRINIGRPKTRWEDN